MLCDSELDTDASDTIPKAWSKKNFSVNWNSSKLKLVLQKLLSIRKATVWKKSIYQFISNKKLVSKIKNSQNSKITKKLKNL